MKWAEYDVDMLLRERAYIDTAIIPLIPVSYLDELKQTVLAGEYILSVANELENKFKGRMMLFPPFTYLTSEAKISKVERVRQWVNEATSGGSKHVLLLTSDSIWSELGSTFEGELITLPTISEVNTDVHLTKKFVTDQINDLSSKIMELWRTDSIK